MTTKISVIFETGNRKMSFQTLSEERISNALMKLLNDKRKTVCLSSGNGETGSLDKSSAGLSQARSFLEQNQYRVEVIGLEELDQKKNLCTSVAIISPKFNFKIMATRNLEQYLLNGGAVIVLVDAVRPSDSLNTTIEKFGLRLSSDFLLLDTKDPRSRKIGKNATIVNQFDFARDCKLSRNTIMLSRDTRSVTTILTTNTRSSLPFLARTTAGLRVRDVYTIDDLKDIAKNRLESGEFGFLDTLMDCLEEKITKHQPSLSSVALHSLP